MKIAIMHPTFLPWIGYFSMIKKVDVFVLLDSVQFDKRSWQQRNKIKSKNCFMTLTVPVISKGLIEQKINEVRINKAQNYIDKHIKSITQQYSKSNFFYKYSENIFSIYKKNYTFLCHLNINFIKEICNILKINTNIVTSSSLNIFGKREYLLLEICKHYNAKIYLSPLKSSEYLEKNNVFEKNNLSLEYFNFDHPTYKQINGNFISHLSSIDLIFNHGPESSNYI